MAVTPADINRIISGYERAKDDAAWAATVKFEMQQQADGSYKFVISEFYNGRRWNR